MRTIHITRVNLYDNRCQQSAHPKVLLTKDPSILPRSQSQFHPPHSPSQPAPQLDPPPPASASEWFSALAQGQLFHQPQSEWWTWGWHSWRTPGSQCACAAPQISDMCGSPPSAPPPASPASHSGFQPQREELLGEQPGWKKEAGRRIFNRAKSLSHLSFCTSRSTAIARPWDVQNVVCKETQIIWLKSQIEIW